ARAHVDVAARAVTSAGSGNAALRTAVAGLSDLSALRARVDGNRITRSAAFDPLTAQINALLSVDIGVENTPDMRLRASVTAALSLRDLKEYVEQERAFLYGILIDGGISPDDYRTFVNMQAGAAAAQTRFNRVADQHQSAMLAMAMGGDSARTM